MKSKEIRSLFLNYFKRQGHTIVPSDNLIPSGDPTLLFTSAGMVQFKKHFLGLIKLDYRRAASSQKCLRTSDIDQIGRTNRHLSFFEMLGNFSFGDYFKQDAIFWAWDFMTGEMAIDKNRLYATIYKNDEEAFEYWKKIIPQSRIYRLGEETNYWNMGATGPCGPCSELLFDRGEKFSCGKNGCGPECGCDRYLEVWNLVFTQYDRQQNGEFKPLPQKNIDTGMGFERLVSVYQDTPSPFETDLFSPIISNLGELLNIDTAKHTRVSRLISDHLRALIFMSAEGILPSNEGRGYVYRRLLRRASREGKIAGMNEPFLYKLVPVVVDLMKEPYAELAERRENITAVIKTEEEHFLSTLEGGLKKVNEILEEVKSKKLKAFPAEEAFKLFDTYGFPFDLTREIAEDNNLVIDAGAFNSLAEKSKDVARRSWKGSGDKNTAVYNEIQKRFGNTQFIGYKTLNGDAVIKAVIIDGKESKSADAGTEAELILDKSPFYAESGGQVGDTGEISGSESFAEVTDTIKPAAGLFVHKIKVTRGTMSVGDAVKCQVRRDRRRAIMRHHTATHLLHKALRDVLGKHVTQAGSLVSDDRFRFDYTHIKAPTREELEIAEDIVNKAIGESYPVTVFETSIEKAKSFGAMALFGEKYGDTVRCVIIGEFSETDLKNAFSLELCGGTHVSNTADIGMFKIMSDSSVASGVRRIEAIAGFNILEYIKEVENKIDNWSNKLKSGPEEFGSKIDKLIARVKSLEHENESLITRLVSGTGGSGDNAGKISEACGIKIYADVINNFDIKALRDQSEVLIAKHKADICMLVTDSGFVVKVSPAGINKGVDASKIAKSFALKYDGKAGGRQDFAQGGGKLHGLLLSDIKAWLEKNIIN